MFPPNSQNMTISQLRSSEGQCTSILLSSLHQPNVSNVYRVGCGKYTQAIRSGSKLIKKLEVNKIGEDAANLLENRAKLIKDQICHKNIERLFQVYTSGPYLYFVTQYCQQTLYSRLAKVKKIQQDEAIYIFKQIVKGYQFLVQTGFDSIDFKLQNVFIGEGNVIKLANISCCQIIDKIDRYNKDNFAYLPPQMLKPEIFCKSSKSDIWALGILLYEMIYGEKPWKGKNQIQLLENIKNNEIDFKNVGILQTTKELIEKLLQKDEQQRISSIELFELCNERKCKITKLKSLQLIDQLNNKKMSASILIGEQKQELLTSIVIKDSLIEEESQPQVLCPNQNKIQEKVQSISNQIPQTDQISQAKHSQVLYQIQGSPDEMIEQLQLELNQVPKQNKIAITSFYEDLQKNLLEVFQNNENYDLLFQKVPPQNEFFREKQQQMLKLLNLQVKKFMEKKLMGI